MLRIDSPETFRNNIRKMLGKKINNEKICENLEKGIYNSCLKTAEEKNIIKRWDNNIFVQIYTNKLHSIIMNLNNSELLEKINTKKIKAHKLAFMTHQEMNPSRWEKLIEDKKIKDQNRYSPKIEASTDNFTCWKCKSKKCSYYQLQTRSADEPMTTFVTCLDCGNRWKC
tara:strand:- start:5500 stop:6009 length:510 start_codon:yes stop_codon:yes gene_type:complete